MKTLAKALAATGLVAVTGLRSGTAAPTVTLEKRFDSDVKPFLQTYCAGCHTGTKPAAQFDLGPYTSHGAVVKDLAHWDHVLNRVSTATMPPKGLKQPSAEERAKFTGWIREVRTTEARKLDGDPGLVLARRLSNAEYNYTIRDLTGVDIQPAKEFPVDPANTAGFDNSGESLTMSPALMRKYLQAARTVADHMAVTPDGITFAPHPMLVETDREKYAIQRIVNFYYSQPTDYADYFETAWKFKNKKTAAGTLQSFATANKVSPKYMQLVWGMLEDRTLPEIGPVATLRKMWRALPANDEVERRRQCERMRDFVVKIRKATAMEFAAPTVKGLSPTSQPLMNYKFREFNTSRRKVDMKAFRLASEPAQDPPRIPRYPGLGQESAGRAAVLMTHRRHNDPDLIIPANETRAQWEAVMTRFADVFPDNFYISERGRFFPDDSEDKGRLLSAGYHNVMGYWRDDQPLQELILDAKGKAELEKLWIEFDYLGDHTMRTYVQYYFNQSGEVLGNGRESGNERPSDAEVSAPKVIFGLRDQYLAKAKADPKNDPRSIEAIEYHFKWVNDTLRSVEKLRADSQPRHIEAMLKFAAKAYRRPLTVAEREDLLGFYKSLRKDGTMSHEDAIRDVIVRVLMSPNFCYRVDQVSPAVKVTSNKVTGAPLSNYDLASRLSYFLWSTSPDEKLVAKATAGALANRVTLLAEVRRMLQDPKARALATEFAGNWLDFRRFEQHNSVDRDRFPMFTNELREAMFEEPVRYMTDIIAKDRSVLDLLYGKDTFVNPVLAKHYGMPVPSAKDGWVKVEDASAYGRGGLLPMAAFLTQSSPGLRTSPVKRGYWVVKRVLGEQIPPPPPNVPELPQDEAKANKPLRQMLADHRNNPACAGCHARFDGFGLAFENYGPVGEKRAKDLAGRAIDTTAEFPGGKTGDGIAAVREYIRGNRENDFVDNLSRVLLAYSLGRSLSLSDDLLVERMKANLKAKNYKFSALVETIVQSPQFLNRRAADMSSAAAATE
ncbi:hypothetical protein F183_A11410 [Bryobacterales bacterium F-183]|nr:hypothetical protein F183_A11410 [Bryobacterales bacterium F-183]